MNKLDVYIDLNMKMVANNRIVMSLGILLFVITLMYVNASDLAFMLAIYFVSGLMEIIPLIMAFVKLYGTSISGNEAGLYQSLPVDSKTFILGKIIAAGYCCMMALLPMGIMITIDISIYGIAYSLEDFLMIRGYLPSETWLHVSIAFLTACIFMFALAAVILLTVVYGRGVKKMGKLATGIMAAGASFTAAVVVSLPWIVKIMEDGANITVMAPLASLLLTIAILIAAGYGAQNLAERGDIYEG